MSAARLLAGMEAGPLDLAAHRAVHGDPPFVPGPILVEEIARVGLRGRGGGGFPLARKLAAVTRARGRPIVVVNGCEGDPLSEKDRVLLAGAPHLVLDGAVHLARTLGAAEIRIALGEDSPAVLDAVQDALAQRPELRPERLQVTVLEAPSGYVSGQETALVRATRDGVGRPLAAPPRVSERGISRRPTLVSNAETVAQVAVLASLGARGFASVGTREQPGTALVTLTGAVARPGVHEVAYGTRLTELVSIAGGLTQEPRAVLVGGCAGTWIPASRVRGLALSDRDLQPFGAGLGLGAIVVLPRSACPTAELARAAAWLDDRAAGQCGPCINGLGAIAGALAAIRDGRAAAGAREDIERWAGLVTGRGACAHPDGTARFVSSALRTFAADIEDHMRHGRCDACAAERVLGLPAERAQRMALR